jgi:AcrR family transcriptional regulator/DNA-directed RNA polymerase subunit RPC12/RpoP
MMRRQPKQKRSQERVERILQAAAEVFAEVGYEAATTHAIAARAKTAVGSLYQFFPDKLAIFHALEARHMEWITTLNAELLQLDIAKLSLEQMVQKLVETHAAYFQHPIPRVVYIQYFVAPEMFELFDDKFNRSLIVEMAAFFRSCNPSLARQKSELLAETLHYCYNAVLLQALRSEASHREKLYQELQALLVAYLRPYLEREKRETQVMNVMIVMKCPSCASQRLSKNGRRYGKQRYLCKDCGRQFLEIGKKDVD